MREPCTFAVVQAYFTQRFQPLPIGKKKEGPIEYKERHLFTDEVVSRMQLDAGLLSNAWSAASYFAKMLGRACRLSNPPATLQVMIEDFLAKVLFEHEVNLFAGDVDHRMRDLDVMEHVRATFTPLILHRIVKKQHRTRTGGVAKISDWKPFQATSTEKRPAVQAQRTVFNLVPCENEFEQEFADFCDYAADVAAFAKNAGPQKLMIDYLRPDGHRAFYVPDYFVRLKDGSNVLVELKGRVDSLVPVKAMAANEWCQAAKGKTTWQYLYVPYQLFQDLDEYALYILAKQMKPSVSTHVREHDYFEPYLAGISHRERTMLEKNARYLQQNLVYGRSIQKLGTLLFCLDYAQKGGPSAPGIWRDVQKQFAGKGMVALYADLRQLNDFRNTRVAHIETKLDNPR